MQIQHLRYARLGASASQVSNNNNVEHVLAMVSQLQKQLQAQQQRSAASAKAVEDAAALTAIEDAEPHGIDGEPYEGEEACEDDDGEAQADAEMLESVQSDVSSRREAKAAAEAKEAQRAVATPVRSSGPVGTEALLQKLHSSRALGGEAEPSPTGSASGPSAKETPAPAKETPAPAADETTVNSSTHKCEYMRLVPRLQ